LTVVRRSSSLFPQLRSYSPSVADPCYPCLVHYLVATSASRDLATGGVLRLLEFHAVDARLTHRHSSSSDRREHFWSKGALPPNDWSGHDDDPLQSDRTARSICGDPESPAVRKSRRGAVGKTTYSLVAMSFGPEAFCPPRIHVHMPLLLKGKSGCEHVLQDLTRSAAPDRRTTGEFPLR
jgi:hypothetical protein